MGHLVQSRQDVRSTKPKVDNSQPTPTPIEPPRYLSKELHLHIKHTRKLYTDDNGPFPIRFRSGNQYLMSAYHCDSDAIIFAPFKSRNYSHQLLAYKYIMNRLKKWDQHVDLHILYNATSEEYKKSMKNVWKVEYQLVPPNLHLHNATKRAILTFNTHFLAILSGISKESPQSLWDILIEQTKMTLNILQQSTLKPATSAWENFNGPSIYNHAPLGAPWSQSRHN